jgi:hypothetical protein
VGQAPQQQRSLEARPIGSDSLALVVSSSYRLAARRSILLQAVMTESPVIREPCSGSRCAVGKSPGRVGTSLGDIDMALELGSNVAIKGAGDAGVTIAICIYRQLSCSHFPT